MKTNEKKLINPPKDIEKMTPMEKHRYGVMLAKQQLGDKWVEPPKNDFTFLLDILNNLEQRPNFEDNLFDEDDDIEK